MRQKTKRWIEENFLNLVLIILVIMGGCIVLLASIASGQITTRAVIEEDKIIVFEITETKKEIILLPDPKLGISIEDAKKVCLASTGQIVTTEEINKKINFWTFPTVKTKTVVEKEISYDKSNGWQSQIVSEKTTPKKAWGLTVAIVCLFFYFVFLSYMAWKKKNPSAFDFWKKKKSNIGALFVSHLCLFLACLLVVVNVIISDLVAEWITAIFAVIFSASACISIITTQVGFSAPTIGLCRAFSGILFVVINIVLASISARHNSSIEFMSLLAGMMAVSFCVGWLTHLAKKKNCLAREAAEAAVRNTAPINSSRRK